MLVSSPRLFLLESHLFVIEWVKILWLCAVATPNAHSRAVEASKVLLIIVIFSLPCENLLEVTFDFRSPCYSQNSCLWYVFYLFLRSVDSIWSFRVSYNSRVPHHGPRTTTSKLQTSTPCLSDPPASHAPCSILLFACTR